MNALRLKNINLHSPYRVWQTQEDSHYYFQTDLGIQYDIVFEPDTSMISSGAYTIDIVNRQHIASPVDLKLRQTITAIIEEFFEVNGNEVMLYITETGDGKQMFRNRLFIRWFNTYQHHDKYIVRTAEGKMDGQDNFMAVFVRKSNPNSQYIIEVFELITSLLFDNTSFQTPCVPKKPPTSPKSGCRG